MSRDEDQEKADAEDLDRAVSDMVAEADIRFGEGKRTAAATMLACAAALYGERGFYLKAIAILKRANRTDPANLRVYQQLAALYRSQGLLEEGYEQLRVLVEYLLSKHGDRGGEMFAGTSRDRSTDGYTAEIRQRIRYGENTQTEFKSTLRRNLREDRNDDKITFAVIKTIAGFLNTNGGLLLIGVADDGEILGINADGFASSDRFLLHLHEVVRRELGAPASTCLAAEVVEIDGRSICVVECRASQNLVFVKRESTEVCFVRTGPATVELPPSKLLEYASARHHPSSG
jgi:tetratricopeptide (TPR) repeat protein